MNPDAQGELPIVPLAKSGTRAGATNRLQFSVSALLLVMLVTGLGCAAFRGLGPVWLVPVSLAGFSVANLMLAMRRGSNWRMLKLGHWHLAMGLALAAAGSGLAVHGCLDYNAIAGTDKTPGHIVQISAAVLLGPMVGPIANRAATGERPQARRWAAILFTILFLSASPFLVVRRIVPWPIALLGWLAFFAGTTLWFFGAMISLAVFLS